MRLSRSVVFVLVTRKVQLSFSDSGESGREF